VAEREGIAAEHNRLQREFEELRRQHAALERSPVDTTEHSAHRVRLQEQIEKLKAHIRRLRSERGD
jgi:prefoldin subunit 5